MGRNNRQRRLGRADEVARGMNHEVLHDSVRRGPQLDPLQLVEDGHLSLAKLREAVLDL